jgi:hypothetical protein
VRLSLLFRPIRHKKNRSKGLGSQRAPRAKDN